MSSVIPRAASLSSHLRNRVSVLYASRRTFADGKEEDTSKTLPPKETEENTSEDPYLPAWPDGINPHTGERGGPKGPEPTRYGDWERKGRVSDF